MTKLQKLAQGNPSLIKKGFSTINVKTYQNNFRAVDYKSDLSCSDGSPIPLHEKVHMKVQHLESRKIVGILSSCDGKNAGFNSVKLSPVKVDESFVPARDKITKEFLKDTNGNWIPDPNKGGQFCIFLQQQRDVPDHLLLENEKGTKYLKTHNHIIDAAYKKNNIHSRTVISRKSAQNNLSENKKNLVKNDIEDL